MVHHDESISIAKQCHLLGISRGAVYHKTKISGAKINVMNKIDEIYTEDPTAGQRKIKAALERRYGSRISVSRRVLCI